jgi:hypothetical protein
MPQPAQSVFPPIPDEPVQEGARWRFHRPSSEAVARWFATQPLDEEMQHDHYIGGVVLIGQNETVKHTIANGDIRERPERVFTPYMQIGTRVGYFHRLAEHRNLIPVIEPADVPRSNNPQSIYFNGNMDEGLWWHAVVDGGGQTVRYLCATWRVALYTPQSYADLINGKQPMPVRQGRGTKQVAGTPDPNGIAKAQTGAIGRALGVAGILVVGTGIATAEDMMELPGYAGAAPEAPTLPATPTVPPQIADGEQPVAQSAAEELERLRAGALALQTELQEAGRWQAVAAWYQERAKDEGWQGINTVPLEGLKSIVAYMERALAQPTEEES